MPTVHRGHDTHEADSRRWQLEHTELVYCFRTSSTRRLQGAYRWGTNSGPRGGYQQIIRTGDEHKKISETELVGVNDLLTMVLWTKYFIEAQGCNLEHNIIHQDNESTLRMLINRKKSCTPRSKQIKAKFFWQRIITTKVKLSLQNATRRKRKCG